jgi:hypothetical protein
MGRFCEFLCDNGKRCGTLNRSKADRYCSQHEHVMKRRMLTDGYLQRLPTETPVRGRSAQEDVKATKFGSDG